MTAPSLLARARADAAARAASPRHARSCCATRGTRPAPRRWSPTRPRWPPPAWAWRSRSATRTAATSPPTEAFAALARIVAAVDVPVTADCEAGYGLAPAAFVDGPARRRRGRLQPRGHRSRHRRACATRASRRPSSPRSRTPAASAGVDLVLNARVDVHVRGGTLEDGLARARAYREAGADCVYPIFCHDEEGIAAYVAGGRGHQRRGAPVRARPSRGWRELGVARASFGGGLFHVAMKAARELRAVDRAQPDRRRARRPARRAANGSALDEVLVHRALGHPAQREGGRLRRARRPRGRPRCSSSMRRRLASTKRPSMPRQNCATSSS